MGIYIINGAYFIVCILVSLFYLIKRRSSAIDEERKQIDFILWGAVLSSLIAFVFSYILPALGLSIYNKYNQLAAFIVPIIIGFTILKTDFMNVRIFVSKTIANLVAVSIFLFFWLIFNFEIDNQIVIYASNLLLFLICFFFANKIRNLLQTIPDKIISTPTTTTKK